MHCPAYLLEPTPGMHCPAYLLEPTPGMHCPAYLLEPTPGMECPLASGLGTNFFLASLLFAQFEFCNQMVDLEVIV